MTSPKIKEGRSSAEKRLLLAARKEAKKIMFQDFTVCRKALLRFAQNEARKAASRERKRALKEAAGACCGTKCGLRILSLGSQKPR